MCESVFWRRDPSGLRGCHRTEFNRRGPRREGRTRRPPPTSFAPQERLGVLCGSPRSLRLNLFRAVAVASFLATPPAAATAMQVADDEAAETRKVVFVAGERSHGHGAHEHHAGLLLLSRLLNENHAGLETVVYENGWPSEPTAFDDADAIVIFADGGRNHPALPHLEALGRLMDRGVGLVLLHYAVEVPVDNGGRELLDWVGGYFETHWSVNPHWTMQSLEFPDHPITRGVTPYEIDDEWYYHMRFREGMAAVQPILTALPPPSSLERPDGPHSGNAHVREAVLERQEPQHLAWAIERENGGRGFGFTGAHWHWNWGHPMQRRLVMNAIAWAAHADVPEGGIEVGVVTIEDLEANQDYDPRSDFDRERFRQMVDRWHAEF